MSETAVGNVPPYVAAIRLRQGGRESRGSGVLVGPRHVLSCAHVFADIDPHNAAMPLRTSFGEDVPSGWISNLGGITREVAVGLDRRQGDAWRQARYLDEDLGYDLALLELDRPVYGVVPPLMGAVPTEPERWIAFGQQDGEMRHCDLKIAASAFHRERDGGPALSISIDSGLPPGYSGGPLIAVDQRGRHWLAGISALGGMVSPVGVAAGGGPVAALLAKTPGLWPQGQAGRDRSVFPGIAETFACPIGTASTMEFRWAGRHFRAMRPVSANDWRRLKGQPDRIGGDSLPAHLPDGAAVKECLGRLMAETGVCLRLPRADEVLTVSAPDAAPPFFGGNLALLSHYDAAPDLSAPLPGTAEWAMDGGEMRCLSRGTGSDPLRPLDRVAASGGSSPHLRCVLRPVFGARE